jgi:cardiolipin synthase A/B
MIETNAVTADLFPDSGSYPVREGNFVRPLIDGVPAFRRICESVEAARSSVWITVAFHHDDFALPDGRGSLFDFLDRQRARGLDVRVIFWRHNAGSGFPDGAVFSGSTAQRAFLASRSSSFSARWDRAEKNYCQHQKSWLVDAGMDTEVAFVGGINLEAESIVEPGHAEGDHRHTHDIYLELQGPAATDVHHNFVQRWNEASERGQPDGAWPQDAVAGDLAFPQRTSAVAGDVAAQVQRTVRAGRYTNGHPAPGGNDFAIQSGERTCFDQYERAIAAAEKYIYLENQALGQPETVEALHRALERGVIVTVLVPATPNQFMSEARKDSRAKPFFDRLGALGDHPGFLLAGISRRSASGVREPIYVHAKAGVIDDRWATIGSCNIGARSFFGDTELNVSFVSEREARAFRLALFEEHLGGRLAEIDGVTASRLYQDTARRNAARQGHGDEAEGLVFALDPRTYGA